MQNYKMNGGFGLKQRILFILYLKEKQVRHLNILGQSSRVFSTEQDFKERQYCMVNLIPFNILIIIHLLDATNSHHLNYVTLEHPKLKHAVAARIIWRDQCGKLKQKEMPSTVRDHGIVRRMASLPRSIMEFIGRGRRRNQHTNIPLQPQDHHVPQPHGQVVVQDEWSFLESFEQQFGTKHPFFYACRFMEAIKLAEHDHKFLFMYLHSPDHPFANVFCKETLCSEPVIQFLDVNFVCWGGLVDRGEGVQMVATLSPATFPCCAVIAPTPGESIAVLQQVG